MIPARLARLGARLRAQFSRGDRDRADFRDELAHHLDALVEEERARGASPEEALRRARIRLGGIAQLAEAHEEQRRLPLIDTAARDLRFAARVLRRSPAFALTAILTLGVGIGSATAMFGIVRAVLVQPLPYAAPERLVRVFETNPLKGWTENVASPANYADWRRRNRVFTDIGAWELFDENKGSNDMFLDGFGEPQRLRAIGVSGTLLQMLGRSPLMGRTFTDAETYEGKSRVVVLGYGAWQSVFNGDPAIVGRTISLSGRAYDVVGVMPKDFFFPRRDVQLWYPLAYAPDLFASARRPHWLSVVARLRPGVSIEQARADMTGIAAQLEREYPDTNTQMGVRVDPYHESLVGQTRTPLLLLLAAVGVLFLIVCVNLASLQIGRIAERAREMAIRRALGAGRRRLVGQLAVEALLLSVAGSVVAIVIALAARAAVVRFGPATLPMYSDLRFDTPVLLVGAALALGAPLLFGVLPAVAASGSGSLGDRTGGPTPGHRRVRDGLVVGEVAMSIVLVIAAGLLLRSLARLQSVDPGFRPQHVLTFGVELPPARYPDRARRAQAVDRIEAALRQSPGAAAVGATSTLALGGSTWTGDATVEGRTGDYERELRHTSVSPGYFTAMGISLLRGRLFDAADTSDRPPVAIVNQALARKYFGRDDVVGRRIKYGRPTDSAANAPWVTIVGVVADSKQDGLADRVLPQAYEPMSVRPMSDLVFAIRTSGDPRAVAGSARAAVQSIDRALVLTDVRTMEDVVRESVGDERFRASLIAGFAAAALLLAAVGVYGVLAYFVTQRRREIGIRLALGARASSVVAMVARQAARAVVPGLAAGLVGAWFAAGLLRSLLFGIERLDAPTYAGTVAVVGVLAAMASVVPALRAARVDPMSSLRQD